MRKKIVFMLFLMCLPGVVWAAQPPAQLEAPRRASAQPPAPLKLTLDEAVTLALRDNRDLRLKTEDVQKAKYKIAEAQAALFPALTASGSWSQTRGLYDKDLSIFTGQVGVKQLLYKGGQVINAIKAGEHYYAAAEAGRDQARSTVIAATKKAFYAVLLAREFSRLNQDILRNTEDHAKALRQRYASGLASASEMAEVDSSLVSVRQEYEASENQAHIALDMLKNILSVDQSAAIEPSGSFVYDPKEMAYEDAFLQAMKSRPEIRQLTSQLELSRKSLSAAKAGNRPTVAASWDYYGRSHALTGTPKNTNDYNVLAVSVSWPVFDGWLTKAKVEQALADLKEAELLKEKGVRDIASDVQTAYLNLRDAAAMVPAADAEAAVYCRRFEEMQEKFKQGLASQIDKDDAALRYAVAVFNRSQSLYDYSIAQAVFEKSQGGL